MRRWRSWAADAPLPGAGTGSKTAVVFAGTDLAFGAATKAFIGATGEDLVKKAAAAAKFKGKVGSALEILAPAGFSADRLVVVGVGADKASGETEDAKAPAKDKPFDVTNLGGAVASKIGRNALATILFDLRARRPSTPPRISPSACASATTDSTSTRPRRRTMRRTTRVPT